MGILDERSCITVEVNRFLRIEEHCLSWVYLEDEVLQGTEADHLEECILLLLREVVDLSKLERSLLCSIVHGCNQIVCIYDCSLT